MAETSGPGPYGILLSSFFDGTTGMRLQSSGAPGKDALILGAFLGANEWANMIGLYELPLSKIARKLPALKGRPVVTRAFALLDQERYAHYDEASEFVWVREMARVRLFLTPGQVITNNNRLKGAQACYQRLPANPFLGPFFDRYHLELALRHRRGGTSNGLRSDSEATSNGLRSDSEVPVVSPQTPLQVPSNKYQDQGSGNIQQVPVQAAAAPRLVRPADSPEANVEVITSVVLKDILPLRLADADLPEATKARCAQLHIAYDGTAVRKAIESAQVRQRLPMAKHMGGGR